MIISKSNQSVGLSIGDWRRNAVKDNKYEKILLTSAKLFSRRGANGTSFPMIADKVGLGKSTLFHYFKNKEELVLRVLEKSVNEVNNDLEAIIANANTELTPERKLKKAIDIHLRLLAEILIFHGINSQLRCNSRVSMSKLLHFSK